MSEMIARPMIKRVAGLEMNAMTRVGVLPGAVFDSGRITSNGTPIHDIDGDILFYRVPVRRGRNLVGTIDIAASDVFRAPTVAVNMNQDWNPLKLMQQAKQAARSARRGLRFTKARFVAYSFPKIGVQFLRGGRELLMLELGTWKPVPPVRVRRADEPPGDFERWSLIKETPVARIRANKRKFQGLLDQWDELCPPRRPPRGFIPERILVREFERIVKPPRLTILSDSRVLHYSTDNDTHEPCYELMGQQTSVWCVAASVQMVLAFYRYEYEQTRIASELGLGTLTNPNGLPYSQDPKVVTVLEKLTRNALDASMNTSPDWSEFRDEIKANRPLVSFVPGHSRTVAGYSYFRVFPGTSSRMLQVYDPWPPNQGVISWENFDNTTYRRTFTAELQLA